MLLTHGRQNGLGYGHLSEEVCLKLQAQLVELNIFRKSADTESRIVYEYIDSAVSSPDLGHDGGNALEVGYVELSHFNARR